MYDTTTYHLYSADPDAQGTQETVNYAYPISQNGNGENFVSTLLKKLSLITFAAGVLTLVLFYAPSAWYTLEARSAQTVSNMFIQTLNKSKTNPSSTQIKKISSYVPSFDAKLPLTPTLKVPAIGVDTGINEASLLDHESALKLGVWRVPDFGTPTDRSRPTILVAHRYGYLEWSNLYRRKNSFYNLPKLKVGDTVEIDWQQRKYIYEIYKTDETQEITDYSADLILYTCESLNGENRVFEYARLLEI